MERHAKEDEELSYLHRQANEAVEKAYAQRVLYLSLSFSFSFSSFDSLNWFNGTIEEESDV